MTSRLDPYLDDLARRIDDDREAEIDRAWRAFLDDAVDEPCFVPPERPAAAPGADWPTIPLNDALHDGELMAMRELSRLSGELAQGGRGVLAVRCNFGVGIMASQWGCRPIEMPREQEQLPTPAALGSRDAVRKAIGRGTPALEAGQGGLVWETAERLARALDSREPLRRWVGLVHPDGQGPIDTAELVLGSDLFLAFLDESDLVNELIEAITQQYLAFFGRWFELYPQRDADLGRQPGLRFRGRVMLREDSLMNISPETYREFGFDADQRILNAFGGIVHYCGRGEHFIETVSRLEHLTGVNLTQPHLNDMETIYRHTIDRGLKLIGLRTSEVERALAEDRDLCGRVHCGDSPAAAVSRPAAKTSPMPRKASP